MPEPQDDKDPDNIPENKPADEHVHWAQYRKDNKAMRDLLEEQGETIRVMNERLDQPPANPPANNGVLQNGGSYDELLRDPDAYIAKKTQPAIDQAKWNEGKERAVDYIKQQKEYTDNPDYEGEVTSTIREMRKNPQMLAAGAAALLREEDSRGKKEPENGKGNGETRVSKKVVASLKSGGSKGNGGFTRAQLKLMTKEEAIKRMPEILAAQEAGLITD